MEPPLPKATSTAHEDIHALYQHVREHMRQTAVLTSVDSLLGWDERVMLPSGGAEWRAEQMSFLAGLAHERRTRSELGEWLDELLASPLAEDPASDSGATIRELKRDYDRRVKIPQSLVQELRKTSVLGQQVWEQAREKNDFEMLRPLLEKMFDLCREQADCLGWEGSPYDPLLDDFERGATTAQVADLFSGLREELVPLVHAVNESGRKPPDGMLSRPFPVKDQERFTRQVAERIGFDFKRGRMDVTVHPFCATMGPDDVRITTRYDENNFANAFFGIVHETGHGLYEQGLSSDQFGLPLGAAASIGLHESQSRMWENMVARSRPFWDYLWQEARDVFPGSLEGVALEDFYFGINQVRSSLIRVDADEVTYNLHIMIRFELERAVLEGNLKVADLPGAWNARYQEYLGIEPPDVRSGVLQDIHWPGGAIGYFPTYTLGNVYAAQLYAAADAELGLDERIAAGDFASLLDWLRRNVHSQGQRYTGAGLVEQISGKPVTFQPLMAYLKGKLGPLYGF